MSSPKMFEEVSSIHEALFEISLAINKHLDLSAILARVVHCTSLLMNCENASIVLWNSRMNRFERGDSSTAVGEQVANRVRSKDGATRWILDHKEPLLVSDVRQDPFNANIMIAENNIRAYMGVPIQQEDEVLGVLYALSNQTR